MTLVGVLLVGAGGLSIFALGQSQSSSASDYVAQPVPTFSYSSGNEQPRLEVASGANVLFVGDSYTQGYGADDQTSEGWVPVLASSMGWQARIDGRGGTGWTWGAGNNGDGGLQYVNRIRQLAADDPSYRPDLVVLQGGQNDWRATPEEVQAAVTDTVATVHATWPEARIVVVGVAAPDPTGEDLRTINQAVIDAARALEVNYVNVVGRDWFTTSNSPEYTAPDGAHLNTAGHRFLADHVAETFGEWLPS